MPDRLSPEQRSRHMARIRKKDSGPEIALREELAQRGIAFRTYAGVAGTPDLVLEKARLAVFVHGCFWHGCPKHYRQPSTRLDYWLPKLSRNKARDRSVARKLRSEGWSVLTVWECQVKADASRAVQRILDAQARRRRRPEIDRVSHERQRADSR